MFKVTGNIIRHKQIPDDVFKSFVPADSANAILQLHQQNRDYHSFGDKIPGRQSLESATMQARGALAIFEEYLEHNLLSIQ